MKLFLYLKLNLKYFQQLGDELKLSKTIHQEFKIFFRNIKLKLAVYA